MAVLTSAGVHVVVASVVVVWMVAVCDAAIQAVVENGALRQYSIGGPTVERMPLREMWKWLSST